MLLLEACQTFYVMIDAHPRVDTLQQDSMLPSVCALTTAVRHLVVDGPRVPSPPHDLSWQGQCLWPRKPVAGYFFVGLQ
jgi:hypothetical protein